MIDFFPVWSSTYKQEGNTYIFENAKGTVDNDDQPQFTKGVKIADYKERNEVTTANLSHGKYCFSADIEFITPLVFHASRTTVFQVHNCTNGDIPPSMLNIVDGHFHVNSNHIIKSEKAVPAELKFNLAVDIEYTNNQEVNVDYYIDKNYLTSTRSIDCGNILYIKFGLYRIQGRCDIIQKYTNVKCEKL